MPHIHLKQRRFTCNVSGPFTKDKEKTQKLKKQRRYKIYLQKWIRKSLFSAWHGLWGFSAWHGLKGVNIVNAFEKVLDDSKRKHG